MSFKPTTPFLKAWYADAEKIQKEREAIKKKKTPRKRKAPAIKPKTTLDAFFGNKKPKLLPAIPVAKLPMPAKPSVTVHENIFRDSVKNVVRVSDPANPILSPITTALAKHTSIAPTAVKPSTDKKVANPIQQHASLTLPTLTKLYGKDTAVRKIKTFVEHKTWRSLFLCTPSGWGKHFMLNTIFAEDSTYLKERTSLSWVCGIDWCIFHPNTVEEFDTLKEWILRLATKTTGSLYLFDAAIAEKLVPAVYTIVAVDFSNLKYNAQDATSKLVNVFSSILARKTWFAGFKLIFVANKNGPRQAISQLAKKVNSDFICNFVPRDARLSYFLDMSDLSKCPRLPPYKPGTFVDGTRSFHSLVNLFRLAYASDKIVRPMFPDMDMSPFDCMKRLFIGTNVKDENEGRSTANELPICYDSNFALLDWLESNIYKLAKLQRGKDGRSDPSEGVEILVAFYGQCSQALTLETFFGDSDGFSLAPLRAALEQIHPYVRAQAKKYFVPNSSTGFFQFDSPFPKPNTDEKSEYAKFLRTRGNEKPTELTLRLERFYRAAPPPKGCSSCGNILENVPVDMCDKCATLEAKTVQFRRVAELANAKRTKNKSKNRWTNKSKKTRRKKKK
jgi:hypothetical protein